MAHSLVIGGQPDYFSSVITAFTKTGREITPGDAEKVLDLAPSVRYRAPSPCSGEYYFQANYGAYFLSYPERGILGAVHNLLDVDAKARVIGADTPLSFVYPTSTVASTNTTSTFADVDNDPWLAIPTQATPTTPGSAWDITLGGFSGATLQTSVADSQLIFVYLESKGTYDVGDSTQSVTIEVTDGAGPALVTKVIHIRGADGDTFVTSLLVDPTDFANPNMSAMRVKVSCTGDAGPLYWEVGSVAWLRVPSSVTFDSGWWAVEEGLWEQFETAPNIQGSSIIPYLNSSGELDMHAAGNTIVLFYWDDGNLNGSAGKRRIFALPAGPLTGVLTDWRPEIGLIAEGPAYGTGALEFNPVPSWVDPSIIRMSKGGNDWTIRREPRRRLSGSINYVSAADFAGNLFTVMRRTGISRPFCVSFKPSSGFSQAVSQAVSFYGRQLSFDASNVGVTTAAPGDGFWRVSMTLEESV